MLRTIQWIACGCLAWFALAGNHSASAQTPGTPNMIFILADDLGYGDLGCYGQKAIHTPRLDRMAAEGMRFTQFYAGCTVCAPSRSTLMTGQHSGHTHVRGNASGMNMAAQTLRDEDVTVAELLHQANYNNALIGKWGLGEIDSEGHPLRQGFDSFFGYLNQVHAHNYYPEFLWRGVEKQVLPNVVDKVENNYGGFAGGTATKRIAYSQDLFLAETQAFLKQSHDRPFFLYLAMTLPHANNEASRMIGDGTEIPDYGIYAKEPWPSQDKGQAAMVTRMDHDVGEVLELLRDQGLAENTLVFFTSDNGPHNEAKHDLQRFNPSGPLRGTKRALFEGGIRVPAIAWWPGTVPAGTTSDLIAYSGDWLATACDLAKVKTPADADSLSLVPTLTGNPGQQRQHEYLYWEFYEQGSRQAVRFQQWKAIREPMLSGPIALYDLSSDLGETRNVADEHPQVVAQAERYLEQAHRPHPLWTVKAGK